MNNDEVGNQSPPPSLDLGGGERHRAFQTACSYVYAKVSGIYRSVGQRAVCGL